MEIGQPKRTIIVAPLSEPVPRREPVREPVVVPDREQVPA